MKQFFEQYGGVALGILALLVLIAMITPVGNIIKTSLQGTVQTFSTKMDGQVDTMTESMNAAFTNATGFTGVKNHTYYFNGQIHPFFKENELVLNGNATGATGKNGITLNAIAFDVNVIYRGSCLGGGLEGLYFDFYVDDVLILENVKDAGSSFSMNDDHEIKIVIKTVPNGIKTSKTEYIYNWKDMEKIFISSDGHTLYIETPIYAYDA